MSSVIRCISPIDNSVFAERPVLDRQKAHDAVARARGAQKDWAARPLSERIELVKAGVIDPTKVVRTALQNAASIASLLLTTEALISVVPEKKKKGGGEMDEMGDMDF